MTELEKMFADANDVQRVIVAIRERWGVTVTKEYAQALLDFVFSLSAYIRELEQKLEK